MDIERYQRQLPIIGEEGQRRLASSSVLVVGLGGLGSIVSMYLVAAGIGKLILVDKAKVDKPDLNRQLLYTEKDIGKSKASIACKKLKALNSDVELYCIDKELTEDIARELVSRVDVVVDALDNWRTRFILNKVCIEARKPLVHGGVEEFYGQITTIIPGKTPCLSCFIPQKIEERSVNVLGPTPGVVASIQSMEVIKLLTGIGSVLAGKMMLIDLLNNDVKVIELKRNPRCPVCSGITSGSS